jgi:glycerol uptake facilitator protein
VVAAYVVAQLIGAMLGSWFIHKDHFAATEDEGGKLACFSNRSSYPKLLF